MRERKLQASRKKRRKLSAVSEWQWHRLHMLNGMLAFFTNAHTIQAHSECFGTISVVSTIFYFVRRRKCCMLLGENLCDTQTIFLNFSLSLPARVTIQSTTPSPRFNAVFVHVMHLYVQ